MALLSYAVLVSNVKENNTMGAIYMERTVSLSGRKKFTIVYKMQPAMENFKNLKSVRDAKKCFQNDY